MTEDNSVQDPSRRRRRRRRKRGGSGAGGSQNGSNQNNTSNQQSGNSGRNYQDRNQQGRHHRDNYQGEVIPMTGFDLFCAYWLGIGENNTYRKPNIRDVSRRFDRSTREIEEALKYCGMDIDAVKRSGYDMSLAQLDISVAPEGIDKRELAKGLFEEFVELNPNFKDWVDPEPEPQHDDVDDDSDASEEE